MLKDAAIDYLVDLLECRRAARRRGDDRPPHDATSVREARRFIAATLTEWRLESLLDDALLVASELATNAITHADSAYRLRLSLNGSGLRVDVIDSGDGTPEPQPPSWTAEHGRGLLLVDALTTAWGLEVVPDGGQARLGGARGTRLTDAGFPSGAGQTCVRADSTSFRRAFAPTRRHADVRSRRLGTRADLRSRRLDETGRRGCAPSGTLLRR